MELFSVQITTGSHLKAYKTFENLGKNWSVGATEYKSQPVNTSYLIILSNDCSLKQ